MNDRRKAFVLTGDERAEKPFHYTQCGLDDVFLLNGFELKKTSYGEAFSVKNIDGLHHAIATALICDRDDLNGKEVRFIRKELKLTQEELGKVICVSAQQVARYEKEETPIQGAPLMLLRVHFLLSSLPDDEVLGEVKKAIDDLRKSFEQLKLKLVKSQNIYLRAARNHEWSTVPKAA